LLLILIFLQNFLINLSVKKNS